jgi:hypothetical protein
MAPLWAQAHAAAPIKQDKRTALAAKSKPIVLPNKRDTFKISS